MKKILMILMCGLLICGGSSKKDEGEQNNPSPTPDSDVQDTVTMKLDELLPEQIDKITISVETSTENIEIEFRDEEVQNIADQLKKLEISDDFTEHSGSGSLVYRLAVTDAQGNEIEIVEQGNTLKTSDGRKTGSLTDDGVIDQFVMAMDWVIEISNYEMLTPLHIETDKYIITCEKGSTSVYDLAYLKDVGFDPFAMGFSVTVDGTDEILEEMPVEGDALLILTKGNASYQLKVTSSVK